MKKVHPNNKHYYYFEQINVKIRIFVCGEKRSTPHMDCKKCPLYKEYKFMDGLNERCLMSYEI